MLFLIFNENRVGFMVSCQRYRVGKYFTGIQSIIHFTNKKNTFTFYNNTYFLFEIDWILMYF